MVAQSVFGYFLIGRETVIAHNAQGYARLVTDCITNTLQKSNVQRILWIAEPPRDLKTDTVPSMQLLGLETGAERRRMTLVRVQCVVTVLPEHTAFRIELATNPNAIREPEVLTFNSQ